MLQKEELRGMKNNNTVNSENELIVLCNAVREFISQKKYQECWQLITEAMKKHPHAPQPHNLIGLLLESEGDHLTAMKHFRAAWALDPTYIPVRHNMERFGTFFSTGEVAYDETDCPKEQEKELYKLEYDEHGIGHVIRRNKNGVI